jgi:hypothetical protein
MLKKIYENFWYKEQDEKLSGASAQSIQSFEEKTGIKLPDEFKHLYTLSDGGFISLELNCDSEIAQTAVPAFSPLSELQFSNYDSNTGFDYKEAGIPEGLIILGSHGYDFYALDYRGRKSEPKVVYGDGEGRVDVIANSFLEFILCLEQE